MTRRLPTIWVSLLVLLGCSDEHEAPAGQPSPASAGALASPSPHLIVWAGDDDAAESDFLAILDADPASGGYGSVLATLPVGAKGTMPHHTEYEYPPGHLLFANGWSASRTFRIDLSDPLQPSLLGDFERLDGYGYPHAFVELPNGNVLGAFQSSGPGYQPPGALVEIDRQGNAVQSGSSATPEVEPSTWPYSLAVVPELGLAVSSSSEMGLEPLDEFPYKDTWHAQVWSLDGLELVANVELPADPPASHHIAPSEPRRLDDGTVYVVTFSCGLYRLEGLSSDAPSAELVHTFPGELGVTDCGVPVVVGDWWVQTVPAVPGLIVLDVSEPTAPVEVALLKLDKAYARPHWLAADRAASRLVVTGMMQPWVLVVDLDPATGALTVDEAFRDGASESPGVTFAREQWPHGASGAAQVHGALFRPGD